jgi:hypothetical protein
MSPSVQLYIHKLHSTYGWKNHGAEKGRKPFDLLWSVHQQPTAYLLAICMTTNDYPELRQSIWSIIICDDNVDGASGRNNVVGKTPFELLDASPKDDPAGAPVVGRYLNSHVGQMVRSAPEQRKHTPGGGK